MQALQWTCWSPCRDCPVYFKVKVINLLNNLEFKVIQDILFFFLHVSPPPCLLLSPSPFEVQESWFCLAQMNTCSLSQIIVIKIKCLSLSCIIVFPKRLYNDLLLGRRLHDLSVQGILYLLNLSVRSRTLKKKPIMPNSTWSLIEKNYNHEELLKHSVQKFLCKWLFLKIKIEIW